MGRSSRYGSRLKRSMRNRRNSKRNTRSYKRKRTVRRNVRKNNRRRARRSLRGGSPAYRHLGELGLLSQRSHFDDRLPLTYKESTAQGPRYATSN